MILLELEPQGFLLFGFALAAAEPRLVTEQTGHGALTPVDLVERFVFQLVPRARIKPGTARNMPECVINVGF